MIKLIIKLRSYGYSFLEIIQIIGIVLRMP